MNMIAPADCEIGVSVAAPERELFFGIPPKDLQFLATELPEEVQQDVRRMLKVLQAIHFAKNKDAECKRLAALMQRESSRRGYSAVTLRRHYYNFRATGDWRVLINRAKAPVQTSGLPPVFINFWRGLCDNHQRNCASAHADLLHIWRTKFDFNRKPHTSIPGYENWPAAEPTTSIPSGWSYENMIRHAPDDYEKEAARHGRIAASQLRLKVYTSRVGLRVGEFFQFDDHEYNLKVNFPGQWRAMRPRGFCAIDVLSACCFSQSFKPTLWDEDEEKKKVLTERDMMWFVMHVLTSFGYRTDERGTALIVEWGTAAIKSAFASRIYDATGRNVRVERSGKFGSKDQPMGGKGVAPSHGGQFEEASKGNYRFKALIESFFGVVDSYLASAPGQVGKDRDHSPAQLHGAEAYNNALLKAAPLLPTDQAALVKFPFHTWTEFLDRALFAYNWINNNTEHSLQGWEKLGFVAKEWRLDESSDWLPQSQLLQLPDAQQQLVVALIQQNQLLTRARQLSRMEVFNRFRSELTPLPHFQLPVLMGIENALRGGEPLTVRSGIFEFEDREISSDPLRFVAMDNYGQRMREGEKYVCFVNPFNPSVLVACDSKLRVLGECKPCLMPARNDIEGIRKAQGAAKKWEAAALAELQKRNAGAAAAKTAMHKHNAEIFRGEPAPKQSTAKALEPYVQSIEEITETLSPAGELTSEQFTNEEIADLFASPNQTEEERNGIDS